MSHSSLESERNWDYCLQGMVIGSIGELTISLRLNFWGKRKPLSDPIVIEFLIQIGSGYLFNCKRK